jgi:hypothetical protein
MRTRFGKLLRKTAKYLMLALLVALAAGAVWISFLLQPDESAQKALAATRRLLQQQGFKTDVADFDFSTTPALRTREAVLKATFPGQNSGQFLDHPNLCEIIGSNTVIVVWLENSLQKEDPSWSDSNGELTWDAFRAVLQTNQAGIDAACAAVLSGPIHFDLDAHDGGAMRLPHLALMKNLELALGDRTILAIHDGEFPTAWTNLMAATRIVTAYEPEPVEISELVRFANTKLAFNAIWQALQSNGWTDDKLARLQQEWEMVDFFKELPETVSFKRASSALMCESERQRPLLDDVSLNDFIKENLKHPQYIWPTVNQLIQRLKYVRRGSYEDETNLLLFYRDRESELKADVAMPTWQQMRLLPGVTNHIFFQSKHRSRVQAMLNLRELSTAFQKGQVGFLGRAAEAETRRRILLTALTLERYRLKHGAYPQTLDSLAPAFLKSVPVDFMDGQPLRYRLRNDGHFLLYSIGLDCMDDGGIFRTREQRIRTADDSYLAEITPPADIIWPLPAGTNAIKQLREEKIRDLQAQNYQEQQRESAKDWEQSLLRQSRVTNILMTQWSPILDPGFFGGRSAAESLRNTNSVAKSLTLAELMTPRQVLTGHEPEDLTFQFPVSYDAIGEHGFFLLLDAETNADALFASESGAKVQEHLRAANGDCQLVWHTIFDPPGKHALQVELTWDDAKGAETWRRGPAIAVTTSNLCQFSFDSSTYDVELGATFHARLPEKNGSFVIECVTTNGSHLATLNGNTTNGEFNIVWNLVDEHGHRLTGETFNSVVHITLPDSGRTQIFRGP